jgi:hypothetical protein
MLTQLAQMDVDMIETKGGGDGGAGTWSLAAAMSGVIRSPTRFDGRCWSWVITFVWQVRLDPSLESLLVEKAFLSIRARSGRCLSRVLVTQLKHRVAETLGACPLLLSPHRR